MVREHSKYDITSVLMHSYTCTVACVCIWLCECVYLVVEQVCVVPESRHRLSLGAAMVVSFSLSYMAQLLIQGFLLKLELLGVAGLQPQLLLQGTHHPILRLQLIHLQEGWKLTWWWVVERVSQLSIKCS